ncbi:hypothetical protein LY78DRAFT_724596 [Colletotrichum sublineola]|uniref:Uncharacterized protein n=1 Tax=Colletotrichum sublineola TaxID=1173701 RepID=A0A066XKC8_COLSU|nr:hypothetical protein LY78DRAFT_724596 [Colletotrichum sublineola]KDN69377.1 hypothetical protein CSUB01_10000 [Colletotrichum sublineola]
MDSVGIGSLPVEICVEIAEIIRTEAPKRYGIDYDTNRGSLYALCLVNKKWCQAVTPRLYHTFTSGLEDKLFTFLRTLIQCPNLAIFVKSVWLSPVYQIRPSDKLAAFKHIIISRALVLGIPLSHHDPFLNTNCSLHRIHRDVKIALEDLLLLHTPNIESINLSWADNPRQTLDAFRYLNSIAQSQRQWHGMRRLRSLNLEVFFPDNSPESHHMAYLSNIASVTPSLQHLQMSIYEMSPSFQVPAILEAEPQMPVPPHVVAFLGRLRSICITSRLGLTAFERTFRKHIGHCKSLEEIQYSSGCSLVVPFMRLLQPLSHTLKRLGLLVKSIDEEPIWDPLGQDHSAVSEAIAGLTSLEVLRINHSTFYDFLSDGAGPCMSVPFVRALPRSLRVFSIGSQDSYSLKKVLWELRDRAQDGMLPNFNTLHVTWDGCYWNHPFIEAFSKLGVDMKIHGSHEWRVSERDLMLEAEGWALSDKYRMKGIF